MTIDEVIKHERQVSKINKITTKHPALHKNDEDEINACLERAEYHEQLAKWLEELKKYRIDCNSFFGKGLNEGYNEGYTKAIDDFAEMMCVKSEELSCTTTINGMPVDILTLDGTTETIFEVAEQLKAGGVE